MAVKTTLTKDTLMAPTLHIKNPHDSWQTRHNDAVHSAVHNILSSTVDVCVVRMFHGWANYAEVHKQRFESLICEDYVLGPAWLEIGKSFLTLLNGDLGRLDGGTCDSFVREVAKENGGEID